MLLWSSLPSPYKWPTPSNSPSPLKPTGRGASASFSVFIQISSLSHSLPLPNRLNPRKLLNITEPPRRKRPRCQPAPLVLQKDRQLCLGHRLVLFLHNRPGGLQQQLHFLILPRSIGTLIYTQLSDLSSIPHKDEGAFINELVDKINDLYQKVSLQETYSHKVNEYNMELQKLVSFKSVGFVFLSITVVFIISFLHYL